MQPCNTHYITLAHDRPFGRTKVKISNPSKIAYEEFDFMTMYEISAQSGNPCWRKSRSVIDHSNSSTTIVPCNLNSSGYFFDNFIPPIKQSIDYMAALSSLISFHSIVLAILRKNSLLITSLFNG